MNVQTMNFNWVDFAILGVIAFSAIISVFRGFIKEAISLAAWACGLFLSLTYATELQDLFRNWSASVSVRYFFSFVAIFIGVVILGMIVNFLVAKAINKAGLSFVDRLVGLVFGLVRGVLIVAVLLLMVANFGTEKDNTALTESRLAAQFKPVVAWLNNYLPADVKSVTQWVKNEFTIQRKKI